MELGFPFSRAVTWVPVNSEVPVCYERKRLTFVSQVIVNLLFIHKTRYSKMKINIIHRAGRPHQFSAPAANMITAPIPFVGANFIISALAMLRANFLFWQHCCLAGRKFGEKSHLNI